jgi:hypothetical protein
MNPFVISRCGQRTCAGAALRLVRLVSLDQCDSNQDPPVYVLLKFSINQTNLGYISFFQIAIKTAQDEKVEPHGFLFPHTERGSRAALIGFQALDQIS